MRRARSARSEGPARPTAIELTMPSSVSSARCGTENDTCTFEKIAERAEAGVEQDVADLGQHFARRAVDRQRQRRLVGQQLLEDRGALLVEHEQRVALDRTRENLMNAGHLALHQRTQVRCPSARSEHIVISGTSSCTR